LCRSVRPPRASRSVSSRLPPCTKASRDGPLKSFCGAAPDPHSSPSRPL